MTSLKTNHNDETIGLFGAYHYGNFGDDLMAVIFAKKILELGYRCIVFKMIPALAEEVGCETCDDFDKFLIESDIFVFGGGGMFLSAKDPSKTTMFDNWISSLLDHANKYNKKVGCFSMGGDATTSKLCLTPGRKRLLFEADFISFRNKNDERYIDLRTRPSELADDVVWGVNHLMHIDTSRYTKNKFGVDLAAGSKSSKLQRMMVKFIVSSFMGQAGQYFQLQNVATRREDVRKHDVAYINMNQIIDEIAHSKFIIASRLHFGMTAWSIGVPACLISPLEKARIAWLEAGLGDYIYSTGYDAIKGINRIVANNGEIPKDVDAKLALKREGSKRHLKFLEEFVNG